MKKGTVKKTIVLGIIILFVGTSVFPLMENVRADGPGYVIAQGQLGQGCERKLARTSDGFLHSVYCRLDGSYNRIYYAHSINDGVTWTEEPESISPPLQNCGNPCIAVGQNDNIHVAWTWARAPVGSSWYSTIQYRVKTTTGWQGTGDVITGYYECPSLAIDSGGVVHLAIGGYGGGAYHGVGVQYLKKVTPSSSWSSPLRVSSSVWANLPELVVDGNNDIHILYIHAPRSGPYYGLRYRRTIGGAWQGEEIIQTDDAAWSYGSLAVDSTGDVYAVWCNANTGQIKLGKRSPSGTWPQPFGDVLAADGYSKQNAVISIDGSNTIHIVWCGKDANSPNYFQMRYRKYSNGWSGVSYPTSASVNQQNPGLIWAWYPVVNGVHTNIPQNGYAFVWNDGSTIRFYKSDGGGQSNHMTKPVEGSVLYFQNAFRGYYITKDYKKGDYHLSTLVFNPILPQYPNGFHILKVQNGEVFKNGKKVFYNRYDVYHEGIDILRDTGTPVYPAASGTIKYISNLDNPKEGPGRYILIWHGDITKLDGTLVDKISTRYLHLDEISPYIKQKLLEQNINPNNFEGWVNTPIQITPDKMIGEVGNTGCPTQPPHLHLEVRQGDDFTYLPYNTLPLNPCEFINYQGYTTPPENPAPFGIKTLCPVDIIITDPDGLIISKETNQLPTSSQYIEVKNGTSGEGPEEVPNDNIVIYERKIGTYLITVIAESGAEPTDTYSLQVSSADAVLILAENVSISNIPNHPYVIISTESEIILDYIPPITNKIVSQPKYGTNDEWVTSSTEFNLTATDDLSGVDTTYYRIWFNGAWTPWTEYTENFTMSGEGVHYLEYCSVDNAGNAEETRNQTHYVDDSPPVVTISASPNSLWPPNHKMKNVLISGSATDGGAGIASVTFAVVDEYDQFEPTLTGFGQIIQLEAWRNGNDMDGRIYTITATATDNLGHVTTALTIVRVPHDQGN